MTVEEEDVNLVKNELWPDEKVVITARQRRVGPAGSIVNPTSVIATDKRIIIVNRMNAGIRKDIESIPFRQITSVRLEHGLISSSVFVRVEGFDTDKGFLKGSSKQEGEIDGLNNTDAKALSDYIERIISGDGPVSVSESPAPSGAGSFCVKCGEALPAGAKFCPKCGAAV